ncbi:acetolactate decarboxylase [uncultured Reyranella sp.]|jgi:acetolactate decarboxylase|uniref:Alpha-acetolactate decarboxylase n=2 Tax=Reyranella aquatilis TaxID=2035356 RepID=A0ABS8KS76_9HYPH|nr:acetolactate decarboxylase [uncultured Reyranella sp.]MCC8428921.1 acetolactate decarboxylase [Reyranella aquatilis]
MDALVAHCEKTGEPLRHFVSRALSDALGLDHSTLFQVSTTGALVQGVYNEAVTIGGLRPHGDFGLGTFEGLDGEMVVLDGKFYQAHADGSITEPSDKASVPFATLTNFRPQHHGKIEGIDSMSSLIAALDKLRRSDNLFFAARLDGHFEEVYWRVACKVEAGVHLDKATDAQAEFRQKDVRGTMLGFWTPAYSRTIGVAGWHLHFLTDDRRNGGHVLGAKAASLEVQVHDLDNLHLAIPETREFLHADLTQDPAAALEKAEMAKDR